MAPASAAEPAIDASVYGAIVGPLDHELDAVEQQSLMREFDRFSDGMLALSERRWAEAAAGFEAVADVTGWYEAAYNAALARRAGGEYRVAATRTEQALRYRPGDHASLFLRASLLQALGRYGDAKAVVEQALASARSAGLERDELLGLLNLGAVQRLLGEPEPALASYELAAALADRLSEPGLEAAAWAGAGYTHALRGESSAAESAMRTAKAAADRAGAETSFAEVEISLAALALEAGDRDAAGRLVDGALADAVDFGDPARKAGVLMGAAGLQRELGRTGPASRGVSEAESLLSGTELHAQLADVLTLRGTWALRDGAPQDAEKHLAQALGLLEPLQAPLALAGTRLKLGRALLEQGRFDAAAAQIDAALASLEPTGALELRRQGLVVSSELRRRRGDLAGAAEELAAATRIAQSAAPSVQARLAAELVLLQAARGDVKAALAADAAITAESRALLPDLVRARVQIQIAYAMHGQGRLEDAVKRAKAALPHADAEITDAARQLVVEALLALDRAGEAEAFLAEQGEGQGALSERVEGRSAMDRYNAAVDAYNTDHFGAAAEGFEAVAQDPAQPAQRRAEAAVNYTASLLQLAQKRDARGEPAGALVALKKAAERGTGADAARAGLMVVGRLKDPAEGVPWAELAAGHARDAGESGLAGQAWMAVGDAHFEADAAAARAAYSAALDAWGQSPSSLGWRATVTWNLGLLAWNAGDAADAKKRLEAAHGLAVEAGQDADARQITAQLAGME